MRVLMVTRDYPPGATGGISTVVAGLVAHARAHGVEVEVVSFDAWRPGRGVAPRAAAPHRDELGTLRVRSTAEALGAAARVRSADVVHVHHESLWAWACAVAEAAGSSTVYTAHVVQRALSAARGLTAETRSAASQAEAVAQADVVTAPTAWALDALGTVRGAVTAVTPPGIDAAWLVAPDVTRSGRARRLFSAGRFDVAKGTGRLLELARALPADAGWTLRLAGGLPENARAERRWLEAIAQARADGAAVEPLGWLGRDALTRELDEAAVFVQLSACETWGQALLEALGRGVPAVACPVGLAAEVGSPAVRAVAIDEPDAWRSALTALDNATTHAEASRTARAAAALRTWDAVYPAWREAWEVAARAGRTRRTRPASR